MIFLRNPWCRPSSRTSPLLALQPLRFTYIGRRRECPYYRRQPRDRLLFDLLQTGDRDAEQ
jgi:hypothetical protein